MPESDGVWVRRKSRAVGDAHTCSPPSRQEAFASPGDLWRCGCGRLWQVIDGAGRPGDAQHSTWRPAPWWRRLTHGAGYS